MLIPGFSSRRVRSYFLAVAFGLAGNVAIAEDNEGDDPHIIEYFGEAQFSALIYAQGVHLHASAFEIREPELVIRNDTRFLLAVTRVVQGAGPVLAPDSRIRWSCDEAEVELLIAITVQADGSPMEYIKLNCGTFLQISEIGPTP